MSKLAMSNYDTAFTYTVGGIPCTITLSEISSTPARRDAHCSDELHEQIDFGWDVFDRKGYRAPWLSRKVKPADLEYFTQQAYEWLHHDDAD